MKKTIFIILLIMLCAETNLLTQWVPRTFPAHGLDGICFTSNSTGYAGGNRFIAKTTDGGISWVDVQFTTNSDEGVDELEFLNSSTGFANSGNIYKTTNAGANWVLKLENVDKAIRMVCLPNVIYATGTNGTFFKSTDQGETWVKTSLPDTHNFIGMSFINASTGFLGGYDYPIGGEKLLRTTDGANSWIILPGDYDNVWKVQFFTENLGFLLKYYVLYKTTNGGTNWTQLFYVQNLDLENIKFLTPEVGWLLSAGVTSDHGAHLRITTNGGVNWQVQINTGINGDHFDQMYASDSISAICSYYSHFYTTTNGGGIFPSVAGTVKYSDNNQPVNAGYVKAMRYDSLTNQIVKVDSTRINTDGSFRFVGLPPNPIDFMGYQDDELDFVPTYYDTTIYWKNAITVRPAGNIENVDIKVKRITNPGGGLRHISGYIYSAQQTPLAGLDNACIYALSGGQFRNYSISQANGYFVVDSLSDGNYTLVADRMGYNSVSLNVVVSGSNLDNQNITMNRVTGIFNESEIPAGYLLQQNYPNPFNPSTEIGFTLPRYSVASLKVYDITGELITTLLNSEFTAAGDHSVTFDGSKLASGVYFYTLVAGDYRDTKKMVLIK